MSIGLILAHAAQAAPVTRATLWRAWNLDPLLWLGLLLGLGIYGRGSWQLAQRRTQGLPVGRALAFGGAWLTLVVALVSPLEALSGTLFAAHMVQHLLLLLVVPVLLVISRPLPTCLWALPRASRLRVATWRSPLARLHQARRFLTLPAVVLLLYIISLGTWHAPQLYMWALRDETVHVIEHLCFLTTAFLLWWAVLQPKAGRRGYGISILMLFVTALFGGVLGALLTFSNTLWYPTYALFTQQWGLTPLDDQRVAGLIMWIPPGIFYLGTIGVLFVAWLGAIEQGVQRREQPAP